MAGGGNFLSDESVDSGAARARNPGSVTVAMDRIFSICSAKIALWTGSSIAFGLAVLSVLVWAGFGPATGYSDNWMLVINTGTTIVTFLMVFLIQASQNRDTAALQMKLDELIRATRGADDALIDIETLLPEEIEALRARYARIAEKARALGIDFPNPPEPRKTASGQGDRPERRPAAPLLRPAKSA